MKPMGPIPPSFEGEEGMLLIGGCGAASLIDEAGDTPLFVYDLNIVKAQVARFRAVMPKAVSLHYALKANSYGPLGSEERRVGKESVSTGRSGGQPRI